MHPIRQYAQEDEGASATDVGKWRKNLVGCPSQQGDQWVIRWRVRRAKGSASS